MFEDARDRCWPPAVLLLAALFAVLAAACSTQESFRGTELRSAQPAAHVELLDQFGREATLSQHTGSVVVLTFLYTHCPDVCPITTNHLRGAYEALGADAGETTFMAVSVDPERDTVEAAYDYLDKWGMADRWYFLVGDRASLTPVWEDYYISPVIHDMESGGPNNESAVNGRGSIDRLRQEIASSYRVIHSAPVYLIDREGRMRVVFTLPFDPQDLVHDLRLLLD